MWNLFFRGFGYTKSESGLYGANMASHGLLTHPGPLCYARPPDSFIICFIDCAILWN